MLNQIVEQKLSDVHSWEKLLSKNENYLFEMKKPASLGALWSRIHMSKAIFFVANVYLSVYSLLMKFFKPFSHSMTVHIKLRRISSY
jgi:hypothetical protein